MAVVGTHTLLMSDVACGVMAWYRCSWMSPVVLSLSSLANVHFRWMCTVFAFCTILALRYDGVSQNSVCFARMVSMMETSFSNSVLGNQKMLLWICMLCWCIFSHRNVNLLCFGRWRNNSGSWSKNGKSVPKNCWYAATKCYNTEYLSCGYIF